MMYMLTVLIAVVVAFITHLVMYWLDDKSNLEAFNSAAQEGYDEADGVTGVIESFPAADVQLMKWIPFSVRDLDEEEQAEHPEWDWILEGELPENGQRILVNVKYRGHEAVQMDEYYNDDGCYLDSGYEIGTEVTHWMPLPEPPKEET